MRKLSKAKKKYFNKGIQNIIETHKFAENQVNHYKWILETKAGKLYITIHDDVDYIFGVFCRFGDVEKAKEVLDTHAQSLLNPYSGKWNFLSADPEELLYNLNSELELIAI